MRITDEQAQLNVDAFDHSPLSARNQHPQPCRDCLALAKVLRDFLGSGVIKTDALDAFIKEREK